MNNDALADEIITRLNTLCADPHVRAAMASLIEARVQVRPEVETHPTIQVRVAGSERSVGFLGFLNGLVGSIPEGEKQGWGYIAANYSDDDGKPEAFTGFIRVDARTKLTPDSAESMQARDYDRRGE